MKYFGTDGIRGIPNKKLTMKLLVNLGEAISVLGSKTIVIATDTRVSKDMLAYAIGAGCLSRGMEVKYAGVAPTPALIYYSKIKETVGIMITASHNPYSDNGIKIINKGKKLSTEEELLIEELIDNPLPYYGEIGTAKYDDVLIYEYINQMLLKIPATNLKICLDCANGATYDVAPKILKHRLNDVVVCADKPNGYNINLRCGSTYISNLVDAVLKNICDIGFSFDGDGDRVICVNKDGKVVDGDLLVYIIATYLKNKGELQNNQVVLSMMCNIAIVEALNKNGIQVIETKVGDKHIIKELYEKGLSIGGENSGHIIMPKEFVSGDGILTAITILNILEETKTSIADWIKDINLYPDKMYNVKVSDKAKVLTNKRVSAKIAEIKNKLNQDCKIIVRPSGTEEVVRVSVMAKKIEDCEKYALQLVEIIRE